jgi:uncharacterized Tic20 family protein
MDTNQNKEIVNETPNDASTVAPGAAPDMATGETSSEVPQGDKTVAMLCHLLSFIGLIGIPAGNILGPLVLWLIKKDEDALVDANGKEVLNFQISAFIYGIVCALLALIVIGFFLLPILIIGVIVYTIIGAMKANEGQVYRYPFSIRFIK